MDTAKDTPAEQHRMEKEDIEDLGTVTLSRGGHVIHCLTVIGQIEGHTEAPQGQKTTKYEHVIPQLVAVQEAPRIEGLLVLLNTVGGDVEAGLALAELIASISKPSATLVLGGGRSIGIPLAVSARHSFIVPTATMTVHPVRHSGLILGVPQTMHCFEQMQQRITGFVAAHSGMPEKRYTQLMLHTGGTGHGHGHGAGRTPCRKGKAHRRAGRSFGRAGVAVRGDRTGVRPCVSPPDDLNCAPRSLCAGTAEKLFFISRLSRFAERSKRLFTRGAGFVPFSSRKTTLWFAIFALAWYNNRINYCVYGKLGNRVEWQRKNENQRNGVLLPAVKRQSSGFRQGLAPCSAACC